MKKPLYYIKSLGILSSIILSFLLTNTLQVTHAAENDKFLLEHDITYEIQEDGTSKVTQDIALTNQEDEVIATNYTLITNQINTTEESGIEDDKTMPVKKELEGNISKIKAFFNEVEIGKGNVKKFTIMYKTKDIVYKTGDVWYINIPKSNITTQTSLYNVKVIIPDSFKDKIFMAPMPQIEKKETPTTTTYYFTKENLINNGVTAAFGTYQILNFKLTYQINNDSYLNGTYEIALPSDIKGYQQISLTNIDPAPKNMYIDKDGNFIAQYKVYSGNKEEVEVTGSVKLITKQIDPSKGGSFENIPSSIKNNYTKKEIYWDTKDKLITELSKNIYRADKNVTENAHEIYNYIVSNLKYDTEVINKQYLERKGAVTAIKTNESLSCMEFTDVFITLARNMGIPAREVNGYALSNDNNNLPSSINIKGVDLLHSWAEFYDPNYGWVQIDPTWGTTSKIDYFTKLDTNHFAFVVRGLNSEQPLPAGMYRYEDNKKLINVDFANNVKDNIFNANLSIRKTFNLSPIHWILGYSRYEVENIGNVYVYDLNKKTLGPGQKTKLFVHKNVKSIEYKDFNGNIKTISIN